MSEERHEPKSRVAIGVLGIVLWISAWTALVVSASDWVSTWPVLVQMLFYLVAGLGWVIPLKPALRWMETGRWR
ncbi:DUF2842 domain-containing protein [Sphingomicrobium sp. XHP0235]|uniref:DUF2842 domain-containing protein n=1 Tax=Sphingomicrobium aquimarinum TaxID=3133971 RepID=UPI0031FF2B38